MREIQQRPGEVAQTRHFRRPVVLLQVDVDRIVAAPRRIHALVPEPLQVRRDTCRTGRRDEQVAPVLEIQGLQPGVRAALGILFQLGVRRQGGQFRVRPAQVQAHPVEKRPVILLVALTERLVGKRQHPAGLRIRQFPVRFPFPYGIPVEAVETGSVDQQQGRLPAAVQHDFLPFSAHLAAGMSDGQYRPEMDAPLRIVAQLLALVLIIARIGMPGGIPVRDQGLSADLDRMRKGRIQPQTSVQATFRSKMYHNYRIGGRCEVLRLVCLSAPFVAGPRKGGGQIQLPAIAGDLPVSGMPDPEACAAAPGSGASSPPPGRRPRPEGRGAPHPGPVHPSTR